MQYQAILPSHTSNIRFFYTTLIYQHLEDRQLLCMRLTKVVAACIFNELLAAGLFLALHGTTMRTDPSTSGRKYRKLVNNAVFIRNESLFVVSAAATSAFQLKHMLWLLRAYALQAIEYGLSNKGKY